MIKIDFDPRSPGVAILVAAKSLIRQIRRHCPIYTAIKSGEETISINIKEMETCKLYTVKYQDGLYAFKKLDDDRFEMYEYDDDSDLLTPKDIQDIEQSVKEFKAGRFITSAELKKRYGL